MFMRRSKKPSVSFPLELSKVLYSDFLLGVHEWNLFRTHTFFRVFQLQKWCLGSLAGSITSRCSGRIKDRTRETAEIEPKVWLIKFKVHAVERERLISLSLHKSIYFLRDSLLGVDFFFGGGGGGEVCLTWWSLGSMITVFPSSEQRNHQLNISVDWPIISKLLNPVVPKELASYVFLYSSGRQNTNLL